MTYIGLTVYIFLILKIKFKIPMNSYTIFSILDWYIFFEQHTVTANFSLKGQNTKLDLRFM